MRLTNSAMCIIAFSDVSNYRKQLDLDYKSFRKGIRKPITYKPLRLWIEQTHKTLSYPFLEGDDTLGLLATGDYKDNCVIVSGDKDMRTIPAWHCFIIDDSIEFVDTQKADLNFCTQVLTGDKSDGYIGCKGVGAVKASRILDGKKNISLMWEAVLQEYQRNGYTIEDAYHQSRLARILREGEYDYKKQEPKLWSYKYEHYRHFEENREAS
jgi:DNA polymerase-1